MNAPDFWNEPDKAQKVVAQMKIVRVLVEPVQKIGAALEDVRVLQELAEQENDEDTRVEVRQQLIVLQQQMNSLELRALLSGKHDVLLPHQEAAGAAHPNATCVTLDGGTYVIDDHPELVAAEIRTFLPTVR